MNQNPDLDEVRRKIDAGSSNWHDIIPAAEHDRLVERVKNAVGIYSDLVNPRELRTELVALEKATRSPSAPISELVSGLSTDAKDFLSQAGPLPPPPPPNDPLASEEYYNDIRSRLVRAQKWKPEGEKRRKQTDIVGPVSKMGPPTAERIDALVGMVSAAYADATGIPATRSWSHEEESAVERIVEDVFANLGIDATYSAKKAVERHIHQREHEQIKIWK